MKTIIIAIFMPVFLMSCTTMVLPTVPETSVPKVTVTNIDTPSLAPVPTSTNTPKILSSENNHWYQLFSSIGKDWLSARDYCVELKAHLLTIESESENEFVYQNLRPGSYGYIWLGFTDSVQEGSWLSVTGEPLTYTNWHSGEPDNCVNGCSGGPPNAAEEDYAIFNYLLNNWSDWETSYIPFVCEWEPSQ